ncbi:pentapeptide repeat-containing protein [Streptomyces avermitilis]
MRTALLAMGAGGLAAVGILYTHRTLHQNREGQVTDRYTKAIAQIASDKPVEQLGGIYALERIMRDSVKDHATIVEVLAAFVREHAPASAEPATQQPLRFEHNADSRPAESVQAALTVLGRRPQDRDEPFQINLEHTDLRRANLTGAHLEKANLTGAHLKRANLTGAHLEAANLTGAHMEAAILPEAHMEGAILPGAHMVMTLLHGAHMEGANLRDAHLEGAFLTGAHLEGADLYDARLEGAALRLAHLENANLGNADLGKADLANAYLENANLADAYLARADLADARLEGARDLTAVQVVSARPRKSTSLPAHLAADTSVVARIDAMEKQAPKGTY